MQHDGNLVLYELPLAQLKALWHSDTHGSPGAFLTVGDDGDLGIGLDDGTVLWSTGTAVSDPVSRPDPVRTISVTPGDRSLTVSWTAPGDGGSRITGYEVSYIESQYVGCGDCGVVADVITTTSLRATISELTNGTSYTVYVRARNSVGVGLWVTNAAGTPVASASMPGKVGRPSVSAGDGSLSVSWSAPSDGGSSITGYEVWYSPQASSQSWTRTTTATSVTLTGLTNGISYAVYVRAKNTIGSGSWSDAASGTPVASASVPGKFGRPSVSAGDGSLTVSWSAPDDGGSEITGYDVWARSQDGTHEVTRGTSGTTSVALTPLTNDKSYNVFVRARNSVGSGSWSDSASGTPVAAATAPGKVGRPSVSAGDGSLTVSWSTPSDGGSAITGYEVWYSPQTSSQSWTRTTTATSVTLTGLTNGTSYRVHVRAQNSQDFGSWSDAASGTPVGAATVPEKVAQPSLVAGDGSLTVSWLPPSDGGSAITDYDVRYIENSYIGCADCGVLPWVDWQPTSVSTTPWTRITGLTNGTSYAVVVRAKNSVGAGPWSDDGWGTPVAAASVPRQLTLPTVVVGDGSLTVSWSPPADGGSAITGYEVWYSPDTSSQSRTRPTSSTSLTLTGVTNGTSYRVHVRARNSVGVGEWSDAQWGTPVALVTAPGAPRDVTAVAHGENGLRVSWSAPASTGGSAIDHYLVKYHRIRSIFGIYDGERTAKKVDGTVATYPKLLAGSSYTVSVTAVNTAGRHSPAATVTYWPPQPETPPETPAEKPFQLERAKITNLEQLTSPFDNDDAVLVEWDWVRGATGFEVAYWFRHPEGLPDSNAITVEAFREGSKLVCEGENSNPGLFELPCSANPIDVGSSLRFETPQYKEAELQRLEVAVRAVRNDTKGPWSKTYSLPARQCKKDTIDFPYLGLASTVVQFISKSWGKLLSRLDLAANVLTIIDGMLYGCKSFKTAVADLIVDSIPGFRTIIDSYSEAKCSYDAADRERLKSQKETFISCGKLWFPDGNQYESVTLN